MSPAYLSYVEKKAYDCESKLAYARNWLKDIVNQYDMPFNSDEHNYMIAELRKLKLYLENEKIYHDDHSYD